MYPIKTDAPKTPISKKPEKNLPCITKYKDIPRDGDETWEVVLKKKKSSGMLGRSLLPVRSHACVVNSGKSTMSLPCVVNLSESCHRMPVFS